MIETRTVHGVWQAVENHIPQGRTVREILAALEYPAHANLQVPADWTKLHTEGEVSVFLAMTRAKPISLLIVLHKSDGAPDTPVPTDPNPYFDKNRFAPVEMYDNPAEESDAVIRNAAGVASR